MVSGIGGMSALGGSGRKLEDIAKEYAGEDAGASPTRRCAAHVTSHRINDRAFQLTMARVGEEAKAGTG